MRSKVFRAAATPALQAMRLYWPAFVALQLAAVATVVGYYSSETVRTVAHELLSWKQAGGMAFVAAANVLSGAVIPELLKAGLRPPGRVKPGLADWIHLIALMAILGVMIDVFYNLQGTWFGAGRGIGTLAVKILVDQFIYTLFFAVPVIVAWFAWKENGYSLTRTARKLRPALFAERIPPLFIPNCIFWIPSLIAVYSLPTQLQFLLFIFLNGAWCLVMVFIARETSAKPSEP